MGFDLESAGSRTRREGEKRGEKQTFKTPSRYYLGCVLMMMAHVPPPLSFRRQIKEQDDKGDESKRYGKPDKKGPNRAARERERGREREY